MPRRTKKTFPLTVNVDDGVYNLVLHDPSVAKWRELLAANAKDGSDIDQLDATMTFLAGAIESIDCVEDLSDMDMTETLAIANAVASFFATDLEEARSRGKTPASSLEPSSA